MKQMMEKMVNITKQFIFLKKTFFIDAKQGKAKRVRTTFTEEQLQILQANFEVDSNPDGQDLERIAQITGMKTFFLSTKIFIIERAMHQFHDSDKKLKIISPNEMNLKL